MARWRVQISGVGRDDCRRALEAAGIELAQEGVSATRADGPVALVDASGSEEARRAVEEALDSVPGASVGAAASD